MADGIDKWTDNDLRAWIAMCERIRCSPADLMAVCMHESLLDPQSVNWAKDPKTGKIVEPRRHVAIGINQITMGAGITTKEEFLALESMTVAEQIPWVEKYFRHAAKGQPMPDVAHVYVAEFAPGYLSRAGDENFILYREGDHGQKDNYWPNKGLDRRGDGTITIGDMVASVSRVMHDPVLSKALSKALQRLANVLGGPVRVNMPNVTPVSPMGSPVMAASKPGKVIPILLLVGIPAAALYLTHSYPASWKKVIA